ncbi:hypothetical protein, partial [Methylobacterium sp. NPDC014615]|uniref:hypothetical protein n=1 Tax=Methylobacterium sp. NPDC014615 TaxID=3364148 RepID=UPI0036F881A8
IFWHGGSRQTLSPWDPRSSRRREVSRFSHCVEIRQPGILRASEQLLDAATVQKTTDQLPQFIRERRGFWTDQAKQEHERIIIIERGHDAVLGNRPRIIGVHPTQELKPMQIIVEVPVRAHPLILPSRSLLQDRQARSPRSTVKPKGSVFSNR